MTHTQIGGARGEETTQRSAGVAGPQLIGDQNCENT
jgi:hypothetical protein